MVKITQIGWQRLLQKVEHGDHPTQIELAEIVERSGVPKEAGPYVARRLRDEVRLSDGRPGMSDWDRWWRAIALATRTNFAEAGFRKQKGVRNPRSRAIEAVANMYGLKPDTVRRKIVRELHDAHEWVREVVPTHHEAEVLLSEWLEEGTAELHPNLGFVSIDE